jgi:hypothetical protein
VTALTHMAVGGAVGSLAGGRGAAFGLGMLSHIPLDVMPHYEFEKMWLEVAAVAAFFGTMIVTGHAGSGIFWGALGAVLPDMENLLWRLGIIPDQGKVFPGHSRRFARFLPHGRALGVRHAWWQGAIVASAVAVMAWRSSLV